MKRKRLQAIIFGPQGAGKSTQGQLLSERFVIPYTNSGELLRQETDEKTPLGVMVEEYISSGVLAPDEIVTAILQKRIKELSLDKGFVLDGYPRNIEQAAALDRILKIHLAIHVKVSDAVAFKRLALRKQCKVCRAIFHIKKTPLVKANDCSVCNGELIKRTDDDLETTRRRLATYHFLTEPIASYYRQRGVLLAVNGEQPIQSLFEELVRKIKKLGFVVK